MKRRLAAWLIGVCGSVIGVAGARAESPVKFPAEAVPFYRPANPKQTLMFRPRAGGAPFPAVILLHTCGGVGRHIYDWAERFTNAEYVVLVIDVLTPRGVANNCKAAWEAIVSLDAANKDVAAGLAHLQSLPFVKPDALAVAGFSFGAIAAIRLASASYQRQMPDSIAGLKALAFFYGSCTSPSRNPQIRAAYEWRRDIVVPTIAFLGALDSEAPPASCVEAAERLRSDGARVSYKLYPDTTHAFDDPAHGSQGRQIYHGTRGPFFYRFNREATEDSWRQMKAFFDRELKSTSPDGARPAGSAR